MEKCTRCNKKQDTLTVCGKCEEWLCDDCMVDHWMPSDLNFLICADCYTTFYLNYYHNIKNYSDRWIKAMQIVLMTNKQQFYEEKQQRSQQKLEILKQNLGIDIVLD